MRNNEVRFIDLTVPISQDIKINKPRPPSYPLLTFPTL